MSPTLTVSIPACIICFAHSEQGGRPAIYKVAPSHSLPAWMRAFLSACTTYLYFVSLSCSLSSESSIPLGNPLYPVDLISLSLTTTAPTLVEGSLLQDATSTAISRNLLSHFHFFRIFCFALECFLDSKDNLCGCGFPSFPVSVDVDVVWVPVSFIAMFVLYF